ncbi:hypothetical protein [Streptomyces sp. NPDC056291]|uniref:hypothetical protein n=1 Tax=Streptomyces sp. NPDC056291 TaxID=3345772 RepID=UPI0035D874C8
MPPEVVNIEQGRAEVPPEVVDMINARVWAGIHSRSADVAGCQTSSRIGVWAVTHYFRPLRSSHAQTSPTTRPTCPQTGTR